MWEHCAHSKNYTSLLELFLRYINYFSGTYTLGVGAALLLCLRGESDIPGADSHLLWVVDVRTGVAAVALAKAVIVHAVLARLLLLLLGLPDDGQTSLDHTAANTHTHTHYINIIHARTYIYIYLHNHTCMYTKKKYDKSKQKDHEGDHH